MSNESDFTVNGIEGVPDYNVKIYYKKKNVTALLVPVINEGSRVLQQLVTLNEAEHKVDIVIADGGSTDFTMENIEKSGFGVHAFLTKKGTGSLSAQLRMGFHFCLSQGYESIITMDGNNKDDSSGVESILQALNSGIDFVQGSRFIKGGQAINTPLFRYLAIRLVHAPLTSYGAKFWYTDTTNGFRGHSAKLLKNPQVDVFRDVFDSYELLAYLSIRSPQVGLTVSEVPVIRSYPKGVATPTKIRGISAQFKLLRILFEAIMGRFNPNKSPKK